MEKDYKQLYARQRRYDKKTYNLRHITLYIKKEDTDILNRLDTVPSKNGYILDLIRKDIEKEKE